MLFVKVLCFVIVIEKLVEAPTSILPLQSRTPSMTSSTSSTSAAKLEASTSKIKKTHESHFEDIVLNTEAAVQTNVPFDQLNPSVHGIQARILSKQTASTAVGTAVGVGIALSMNELIDLWFRSSTTTTTTTTEENNLIGWMNTVKL